MRILVTGGAGYVGSHAIRSLARHGHQVTVYDNLSTGYSFLANGFEMIVADLDDAPQLSRALSSVDLVMHFAASAYVGESVQNPRKYFHNNVQNGLALVNAAIDAREFATSSSLPRARCTAYPTKYPSTKKLAASPLTRMVKRSYFLSASSRPTAAPMACERLRCDISMLPEQTRVAKSVNCTLPKPI